MIRRSGAARIVLEDDPASACSPIFEGWSAGPAAASIVGMLTTASHTRLADGIDGSVVLPGDPRYNEARSSFNLLVDQRPAAIAFPTDARDVVAAVALAQRLGVRVAP